jgi:hypothetical protein
MITFGQIGYMGRLGNQMFQFASLLGIAQKRGFEARFPIENSFRLQGSGPFDPSIGRNMLVKCDLLDCFDIDLVYFIPERHIVNDFNYYERIFGYNTEVEEVQDGTCFYGYFQTEKYFKDVRDLILAQFTFKQSIRETAEVYMKSLREKYNDSPIVSIHVRRGDYVMFPDHHPTCSKEYYTNAISKFCDEFPESRYLVFSDDIDWCRNEFGGDRFIVCDLKDAYIELCCMVLCDHHIIANSSFSWWGAWLNKSENKKVVAPLRWFGPAMNKDTSDVYSENWIKI